MTTHSTHTPGLRTVYWATLKDLSLEWKSKAQLNASLFFGFLVLLLFSFAVGPQQRLLEKCAPGFLWLAMVFASVLHLNASVRADMAHRAVEGLYLLPVPAYALFLGKAISNTLYLWVLSCVLLPLSFALYGASLQHSFFGLVGVMALGCMALSGPGTLYAYIAANMRSKDALLPLLLFPIVVPGLLAAVKASALIMHGDPMQQRFSWIWLLIGFNLLYWTLSSLLFAWVIED